VTPELTASFVTLSGAGFAQPARIPFAERCRAAAEAGFTGIGLHTDDYRRMGTDGVTDADITSMLQAHQLVLREIEFLSGWSAAPDSAAAEHAATDAAALGAAFRPHHVTAGEFGADELDTDTAGARLRAICDRVAPHGMQVAVEAFPWSGLKNIRTARAVVDASGAANAGLMIDIWHFYNTRSALEDLEGIRPEQIAAVQLNDGRIVEDDFLVEARRGRLLPGDGQLDITGLLTGLYDLGFRGPYCVEVNYPEFRELSADRMAALAYTKSIAALKILS
jgi:sugar phosphate isomerase/epimerase